MLDARDGTAGRGKPLDFGSTEPEAVREIYSLCSPISRGAAWQGNFATPCNLNRAADRELQLPARFLSSGKNDDGHSLAAAGSSYDFLRAAPRRRT